MSTNTDPWLLEGLTQIAEPETARPIETADPDGAAWWYRLLLTIQPGEAQR